MIIKCVSTATSLAGYRQVFFHWFISLKNENIALFLPFLWNGEGRWVGIFKKYFWEPAIQEAGNANILFEVSIAGRILDILKLKISRDAVHIYKYCLGRWMCVFFIPHLKVVYRVWNEIKMRNSQKSHVRSAYCERCILEFYFRATF